MIKRLFFSLLLLCIFSSAVRGESLNLKVFRTSEVIIHYELPLKKAAEKIAGIYPLIKSDLEKKLNRRVAFIPSIILIHSSSTFKKMVKGNDRITAFAVPGKNIIVIDFSKMERTPFDIRLTLKHELSHLLLHQDIKYELLPKWFDEGVSQWVSEGIADIINVNGNKLLKQAVLSGNYLALKDISVFFPRSPDLFILSYEQSRSIIEYIDSKYGEDKLLDLLNKLSEGIEIKKAVFDVLHVDMAGLETDWHKRLRTRYSWFIYLADNIYWMIFFACAILTVIGFFRLRKRIKTYADEDEEYEDENELL